MAANNKNKVTPVSYTLKLLLFIFILPIPSVFANDTRVIVLGTGTPVPDHTRAGAGVAVIHGGEAYLFDAGGGVVMRAVEAHAALGIRELEPTEIHHLFFTHLHSDHIHDYAELASGMWWRRRERLRAWGPKGLAELTDGMHKMMAVEARIRTRGTPKGMILNPENYRVDVTEIEAGIFFKKEGMTVEAFAVPHGGIKPSFGYKIITEDKSIVISGDTSYSKKLIEKAKGVDILIHEVISDKPLAALPEFWQRYHNASHTPASRLAEVARETKPGTLVLTHMIFYDVSAETLLDELEAGYDGRVILARDLQIF